MEAPFEKIKAPFGNLAAPFEKMAALFFSYSASTFYETTCFTIDVRLHVYMLCRYAK